MKLINERMKRDFDLIIIGSELTMELSLAIKYKIPVKDLVASFHPYLTLSEGIKLAAMAFTTDIKKMSCCAS